MGTKATVEKAEMKVLGATKEIMEERFEEKSEGNSEENSKAKSEGNSEENSKAKSEGNTKYKRLKKGDRPVLAICYDFDKTLSPDDMQAQGFIQKIGYKVEDFWKEADRISAEQDMDSNLAYMYLMVQKSQGTTKINKEGLASYGAGVELFDGVETWFDRINTYGAENNIIVEHYIISSGLKEMIEGTKIKDYFKKIYACSFHYNDYGAPDWPAQMINYTNKTQFLFRIEKGVLDVGDQGVNDVVPQDELRVPFRNMVYIGDSATDIPCMKLVNSYGGHSIGVYNPRTNDKRKVHEMIAANRIKYYAPADYTEGSQIEELVKNIIRRTASNEELESRYYKCIDEMENESRWTEMSADERKKESLISSLEDSTSYANTHTIVNDMFSIENWTNTQIENLCTMAFENTQIHGTLKYGRVNEFYKKLVEIYGSGLNAADTKAECVSRMEEELAK